MAVDQEKAELGVIVLPEPTRSAKPATAGRIELETILVTGSHIPRADDQSAQPVLTLNSADLAGTGKATLAEALQHISAASAAVNSSDSLSIGSGAGDGFSLRTLGQQRVLVLVDGRRWNSGPGFLNTAADLNAIPLAIIERVEVFKDGASAIYGTDAVAGVVNIITRRAYEGQQLRLRYGEFLGYGDGHSTMLGYSMGGGSQATRYFANFGYQNNGEVRATDRSISREPLFGTGLRQAIPVTPQGVFITLAPTTVQHSCAVTGGGACVLTLPLGQDGREQADFVDYEQVLHGYNFHEGLALSMPSQRGSAYATVHHALGAVSLHGEALYDYRQTEQRFPVLLPWIIVGDILGPPFNSIYVAEDNPYNPFGQDIGRASDTSGVGSGAVLRHVSEMGAPAFRYKAATWRLAGSLQGAGNWLAKQINWQAGAVLSGSTTLMSNDALSLDRLRLSLGPLAECQATAGCVPLNVFSGQAAAESGSITSEMLDYLRVEPQWFNRKADFQLYTKADTAPFELPAGLAYLAAGLEWRGAKYLDRPDQMIQDNKTTIGVPFLGSQGSRQIAEAFVELELPLASEIFMVHDLDVNLAVRSSHYRDFGDATNGRVAMRWRPIEQVLLRTSRAEAFRAPTLTEAYYAGGASYAQVEDPCSQWPVNDDENVRNNCQADGVPTTYSQNEPGTAVVYSGNPDLQPETAVSTSAGVVLQPLPGVPLSLSADWFQIDIDQIIGDYPADYYFDSCYARPERSETCRLISRVETTGALAELRFPTVNLTKANVRGFDISMDYALTLPSLPGRLGVKAEMSRLLKRSHTLADKAGYRKTTELLGRETSGVAYPRVRARFSLSWEAAPWRASWSSRYTAALWEACDDGLGARRSALSQFGIEPFRYGLPTENEVLNGSVPTLAELGLCSQPDHPDGPRNIVNAIWYHDAQFSFVGASGTELTIGVNNVLNQDPPVSLTSYPFSFDSHLHDLPGRFAYISLKQGF